MSPAPVDSGTPGEYIFYSRQLSLSEACSGQLSRYHDARAVPQHQHHPKRRLISLRSPGTDRPPCRTHRPRRPGTCARQRSRSGGRSRHLQRLSRKQYRPPDRPPQHGAGRSSFADVATDPGTSNGRLYRTNPKLPDRARSRLRAKRPNCATRCQRCGGREPPGSDFRAGVGVSGERRSAGPTGTTGRRGRLAKAADLPQPERCGGWPTTHALCQGRRSDLEGGGDRLGNGEYF